jgi:hypothetical protein
MQVNWEPADEAWLRNILGQPSGRKLVEELRNLIPKVKALTKESAWIQAVEKQGAENLFNKFLALADSAPAEYRDNEALDLTREGD